MKICGNVVSLHDGMLFIYKEKSNHKSYGERNIVGTIFLSEITQAHKDKCHMFPLTCHDSLESLDMCASFEMPVRSGNKKSAMKDKEGM